MDNIEISYSKNKRILTCAPLPPPHGGITNWYNILQFEAKEKGYTLINVNTSPKKAIDGRSIFYRIVVQGGRMLKQYKEIKKSISLYKDINVAHITTSGQLAIIRDIFFMRLLKKSKIKTVYHIHFGRIPEIYAKKSIEYYLLYKAFELASDVIAIDPQTYQTLTLHDVFGKIHYIPNPVRKVSIESYSNQNKVIFLGNVLKSKGVEELLQAWNEISKKYPEWELVIVGYCDDKYLHYLKQTYSMHNVKFIGLLSHEAALEMLKQASFLVLPSYTEGFPNVVIEAMMCEKAVVATDVGAIKDILSGGCGYTIEPRNINQLYNKMETLILNENIRKSMGIQGRKKALACYDSEIVFKKYTELWGNIEV